MADGTIDLRGAFLPVTTPFDATTGDVDVPAFRSNLGRWFENPVSGILISGSTGESVFLDEEERATLVEAADFAFPDVPGVKLLDELSILYALDFGPDLASTGVITREPPALGVDCDRVGSPVVWLVEKSAVEFARSLFSQAVKMSATPGRLEAWVYKLERVPAGLSGYGRGAVVRIRHPGTCAHHAGHERHG